MQGIRMGVERKFDRPNLKPIQGGGSYERGTEGRVKSLQEKRWIQEKSRDMV